MTGRYDPHDTARSGVILPPSPEVRLVTGEEPAGTRAWPCPLPERGIWKVTGRAGAGVSSFLVDTVLNVLRGGADPAGVLVVSSSKESAAALRREISAHLGDYASSAALVRSVHSLAFSLLRQASDEDLRLITGAEQDAVIRELLEGHAAAGGASWPEDIRPALGMVGFARQLRDFLLRAIERGQSPESLRRKGREHSRPMWTAAGDFLEEYEQVMALSGAHSYSASELVSQVLLRAGQLDFGQWHTIVIDDAQLLAPASGELLELIIAQAKLAVVGGDPEKAVFAFRGANTRFFDKLAAEHRIDLGASQRQPEPACLDIVPTATQLQASVADAIRRRHLSDGVAWSDIAVIVRSVADITPLRRGLLAAGVPVHLNPTDVVLAEQRLVTAMIQALEAVYQPLRTAQLEELMTGPIGGADPVTLRRLIRGLRRWNPAQRGLETLRELITGPLPDFDDLLTEREVAVLERVRGVLGAGVEQAQAGASVEEILWAMWNATGLAERLQAAALRGGATGSQADRDLDAMMALFDAAGDFVERYPGAGLKTFVRHITEQELPTGVRDRRNATPQAVNILTAHGAVGREFDTVVVVGAQETEWPSLGETGTIFDQADLVDLVDEGIDPDLPVSHLRERLHEERRLFHVATTRHTARLLVVAIDAPDAEQVQEPSRFIADFATPAINFPALFARRAATRRLRASVWPKELGLTVPEPPAETHPQPVPSALPTRTQAPSAPGQAGGAEVDPLQVSVLSVPVFVAALRRVVSDAEQTEPAREQAARQLARLAAAGVPGAEPQQWWAAREVASSPELDPRPALSPSKVEALMQCPLHAVLSNLEEEPDNQMAMLRGSLAHAFLEAIGRGLIPALAHELSLAAFSSIQNSPAWKRASEAESFTELLQRTQSWVAEANVNFTAVGTEVPVDVRLDNGVRVSGRIDRLDKSAEGYRVVDLKTGSSVPSVQAAEDNPQLATYQLALSQGEVVTEDASACNPSGVKVASGNGLPREGGVLFYPASSNKSVPDRYQSAWGEEALEEFAAQLPGLVAEQRGPTVTARISDSCTFCRIKPICPVQPEGRMTTDVEG
ncbi:PD-(D/E)XK nuclease family protein [Corynebacterium confusum]|uniref:ATP-dependent DNA helicase n=1 Tax=uncultured Corynebacterium sp. TaxID=159447 RepID=UPI0025CDDB5D|nr:ATP-dependent DNA helicase [uncultured Corynebacterium sp.]